MKRTIVTTITAIAAATMLFTVSSCSVPRTAEEIAATDALIDNALNNGEFIFEVTEIYPQKGRPKHTFDGYTLKVQDGKATTRLPFIGESTLATYGSSDDISITLEDAPVSITKTKEKRCWALEFEGSNGRESFRFILSVYDNGTADLSVFNYNRSTMRYSGDLKEFPAEK